MTPADTNTMSSNQYASKLVAARLLTEIEKPFEQTHLPLNEQSEQLLSSQPKSSDAKSTEVVQEDFLAVKRSIETGQLSKLLIEVRHMFFHLWFNAKR